MDAHKGNVMAYEVEFLLEGRHGLVTFVQNIAHQLGQYLDGVFGLLGFDVHKGGS
mgnify:FL=1